MTESVDDRDIVVEEYEAKVSAASESLDNLATLTWSHYREIEEHLKKNTALGKFIVDDTSTKEVRSNDDYSIRFSEPVFISFINITYEEKPIDFTLECVDLSGYTSTHSPTKTSSTIRRYNVKKATQEIRLKGDGSIFRKKRVITKLSLLGCSITALDETVNEFEKTLLDNKNLVAAAQNLKGELLSELDVLRTQSEARDQTAEEINSLNIKLDQLAEGIDEEQKTLEALKSSETEISSKNKLLQNSNQSLINSVEQLENDRKKLNIEISKAKQELKELQDDKNAFTEDVIEFNKRSNAQKNFYVRFSAYLIVAILSLTGIVFSNALNTAYAIPAWDEALRTFVARLPLLSMIIIISITCFYLIKGFFVKIMDIDRQQLNFAKLGIVAKDVSVFAAEGLDSIDEEKELERRIRLKMVLLKDYLSEELGKQYDYTKKVDEYLDKIAPKLGKNLLEAAPEEANQVNDKA